MKSGVGVGESSVKRGGWNGRTPRRSCLCIWDDGQPRDKVALPVALRDPRLSGAGNWLAKHLTQALDGLARLANWLRTPGERELTARDREIVQPLLARLGDEASLVAELVLGPAVAPEGKLR